MSGESVFIKLDGVLTGHQLTSQMFDSGLLFVTESAVNELKEMGVYPVYCLKKFALHCRDFDRTSVKARNDALKYGRTYVWNPQMQDFFGRVVNLSCEIADESRRATCVFSHHDGFDSQAEMFREAIEAASTAML